MTHHLTDTIYNASPPNKLSQLPSSGRMCTFVCFNKIIFILLCFSVDVIVVWEFPAEAEYIESDIVCTKTPQCIKQRSGLRDKGQQRLGKSLERVCDDRSGQPG